MVYIIKIPQYVLSVMRNADVPSQIRIRLGRLKTNLFVCVRVAELAFQGVVCLPFKQLLGYIAGSKKSYTRNLLELQCSATSCSELNC